MSDVVTWKFKAIEPVLSSYWNVLLDGHLLRHIVSWDMPKLSPGTTAANRPGWETAWQAWSRGGEGGGRGEEEREGRGRGRGRVCVTIV